MATGPVDDIWRRAGISVAMMRDESRPRLLVPLGDAAAYSVAEVCRILQPGMTSRKVHYWLDTGLLSLPIVHGRRGVPTLLSFRQLLEIRTVHVLRRELQFHLGDVRDAVETLLRRLFADNWSTARFARGAHQEIVALLADSAIALPSTQGVLDSVLPELDTHVALTRSAWDRKAFAVPEHPNVETNARVLGGAPVIAGTRIDTSLIAAFGAMGRYSDGTVDELQECYPRVHRAALIDALQFEGLRPAA
jgi:uncharacterized protein (DUF433 family)/DNA-binding transcriptional MerR regulator